MRKSEEIMNEFLAKLENNGFKKENLPNSGNIMTDEYVTTQVSAYSDFLKSGAGDEIRRL